MKTADRPQHVVVRAWLWCGPIVLIFVIGVYYIGRFGGSWAENDTAVFADVIRTFVAEGRLVPQEGNIYANGYTYTAISTFVINLTGVEVVTLQQIVYPLLSFVIILPAWLFYRELIGTNKSATLATVLLLMQPEFLFVTLRSSHEKFTRALMLFGLFLLIRSISLQRNPGQFSVYVVTFYLVAFALAASNTLLATSFFLAITVAFALDLLMRQFSRRASRHCNSAPYHDSIVSKRLLYAVLSTFVLIAVNSFYLYPPTTYTLSVLKIVGADSASIILNSNTGSAHAYNAYAAVNSQWISFPVYFVLSSANWIVLVVSGIIACVYSLRWLRGMNPFKASNQRLAFLFYVAFLLQGALAVVADISGKIGGNMQLRLFPAISVMAVGLVAAALCRWSPPRFVLVFRSTAAGVSVLFALLAVLKATNEPALSNKWVFYQPYEVRALAWSDSHLRNTSIWTEFDERLTSTLLLVGYQSSHRNTFVAFKPEVTTRIFLVSSVTSLRNSRIRNLLPVGSDALRIFDNGGSQIYRTRPKTPYQQ